MRGPMMKLSGPVGGGKNHPPGVAQAKGEPQILRPDGLRISVAGSDARKTPHFAGDHTARVPPVPIPNTEVKTRWADGTARESVWEIR
jgi:hypothetical protein